MLPAEAVDAVRGDVQPRQRPADDLRHAGEVVDLPGRAPRVVRKQSALPVGAHDREPADRGQLPPEGDVRAAGHPAAVRRDDERQRRRVMVRPVGARQRDVGEPPVAVVRAVGDPPDPDLAVHDRARRRGRTAGRHRRAAAAASRRTLPRRAFPPEARGALYDVRTIRSSEPRVPERSIVPVRASNRRSGLHRPDPATARKPQAERSASAGAAPAPRGGRGPRVPPPRSSDGDRPEPRRHAAATSIAAARSKPRARGRVASRSAAGASPGRAAAAASRGRRRCATLFGGRYIARSRTPPKRRDARGLARDERVRGVIPAASWP